MKLDQAVQFLDSLLGIPEFPDYRRAMNGLQVEGPKEVFRVAAAVDAGEATIRDARERECQLLLAHHGLFWGGMEPLTGPAFRKVAELVTGGVALYAAHLPLDAHPTVGNCALLTRALSLEPEGRFGEYEGEGIGWWASTDADRDALKDSLEEVVAGPVHVLPGGSGRIRRVGIVTGGGGSFIPAAAEADLDALITGEGPHHTYLQAMELGVDVFYAGHYATEVFGVKALARELEDRYGVPWEFLDHPSGL